MSKQNNVENLPLNSSKGKRGGWRGGIKPKLPEEERIKRRNTSRKKYSEGKVKIQIPITSELEKRFKNLKERLPFKRNEQLLEYLIDLGEKED